MVRSQCLMVTFGIVLCLGGVAQAQEKKEVMYVYAAGNDAVVVLPPGYTYKVLPSDIYRWKGKVEEEKTASGLKLIMRGRAPGLKIVEVAGSAVTLKAIGAFFNGVEVGRPEGNLKVVETPPPDTK